MSTLIVLGILLWLVSPGSSSEKSQFSQEWKNQYQGGLPGSIIGIAAGFGLSFADGSLKNFAYYPAIGNVFGNVVGHQIRKQKPNALAVSISLISGVVFSTFIVKNIDSWELNFIPDDYDTAIGFTMIFAPIPLSTLTSFWATNGIAQPKIMQGKYGTQIEVVLINF